MEQKVWRVSRADSEPPLQSNVTRECVPSCGAPARYVIYTPHVGTRSFLTHAPFVQVCYKDTGHAEAVQLTFDPSKISFEELLEVFFENHDPTTPNRQVRGFGQP